LALNGEGRNLEGNSSLQGGCARSICFVETLEAIPEDDLIQEMRVKVPRPLQRLEHHVRGQFGGSNVFERAAESAYGGSCRSHDDHIVVSTHGPSPSLERLGYDQALDFV
jgi:hypothetical protein